MKIKDILESIEFEITEWTERHHNVFMIFLMIFLAAIVFLVLITPTWMSILIVGIVCLYFSLPILLPMIIHHKKVRRFMKENPKLIINWILILGGVILAIIIIIQNI